MPYRGEGVYPAPVVALLEKDVLVFIYGVLVGREKLGPYLVWIIRIGIRVPSVSSGIHPMRRKVKYFSKIIILKFPRTYTYTSLVNAYMSLL